MEINVLVNGRPVKEYIHNGITYIEGKKDSAYTINIKNNNGIRLMVVVSVDGLDVLRGKPAIDADCGYIIDPYSSIEIKGYRINDNDVAKFVFDGSDKSYSTEKSNGNKVNNGVIGVRFFTEKIKTSAAPIIINVSPYNYNFYPYTTTPNNITPHVYSYGTTSTYSSGNGTTIFTSTEIQRMNFTSNISNLSYPRGVAGGSDATVNFVSTDTPLNSLIPSNDLGTKWGEQINDKVRTVEFIKDSLLTQMELYYSSRKSLEEIGIDFSEKKQVVRPQAFGYCEPPKNW